MDVTCSPNGISPALDSPVSGGVSGAKVCETVGRLWEAAMRDQGPDSDFTAAIKPIEDAAGVIVGRAGQQPEE